MSKDIRIFYCSSCVLFLNRNEAGHNHLGTFVCKPFTNYNKAIENFKTHQTRKTTLMRKRQKLHLRIYVVEIQIVGIDEQLDLQKKNTIAENRKKNWFP